MKKLVYLLILSLCLNGLAGASLPWPESARAASKTEEKSEKQSDKKKEKSEKKDAKDQSEKSDKDSKSSAAKSKKTRVEKEKEYTLDLAKNNQVTLSLILEFTKLDIKLKDVKSIELEDEKDKKRIRWVKDEDNEGDYIFTVLKNFKELRLRVVTRKSSRLVVLKNGAKNADKAAEAPQVSEKDAGEKDYTEKVSAEEVKVEEVKAEKDKAEKNGAEDTEEASVGKREKPAKDKKEASDGEKAEAHDGDQIEASVGLPEGLPKQEIGAVQEQTGVDFIEGSGDGAAQPAKDGTKENLEASLNLVIEDTKQGIEGQADSTEVQEDSEPDQQGHANEVADDDAKLQDVGIEIPDDGDKDQDDDAKLQGDGSEIPNDDDKDRDDVIDSQGGEIEIPGDVIEGQGVGIEEPEAVIDGKGDGIEGPDADDDPAGKSDEGEGAGQETGTSIPREAEAWVKRGTELLWGTLEAVIAQLNGSETVYIQSDRLMLITKAPTQLLSTVTLLPDGDVFKGSYSVCISTDNPALVNEPTLIQSADLPALGEVADLYIWVKLNEESSPEEEEQGEEEEKPVLEVTASGLEPSGWSRTQPQFTLSGIPEGKEWSYVAIIYDERFVPIASNVYASDQEGISTLRFAMLNELGDIMAASEQYTLQLDWTAPEVTIEADEENSYTLNIYATDKASGLDAVSIDGGKTWEPIDEDGYTVTEEAEKTFEAGDIRVRDIAGNVFESDEDYTVQEAEGEEGEEEGEGEEGGGGGGGGEGGGSGTPTLPHSKGDGEEGVDYDALILDLPDEPMEQLTVGGEPMDLTLSLASAQASSAPVGANQPFTGRLCHWKDASSSDAMNTLLLEAEIAHDLGDVFTYEWHFNGEVYRMLANSGIKYVALKVDDSVAAFPTEGFTGGTRYTELKMQGVSTRKFDYTLAMKLNLDPSHVSAMTDSDYSQECDLSILAKVEDTNYELSNSPQSMMYFYNVFLGPKDMMDQPFGEYRANR